MPEVTINEVMAAYGCDALRHARRHGTTLDYSESSLAAVDEILQKLTGGGVVAPSSEEESARLWTLSKVYGAYVGQVTIAQVGGAWESQDLPDGGARVILKSHGVQMFPLEKIYKRLTEDQNSGLAGYCRALRAVIAAQNQRNGEEQGGPS